MFVMLSVLTVAVNGNTLLWAEAIQKELRQLEDFETFEFAKPDFDPGVVTHMYHSTCVLM